MSDIDNKLDLGLDLNIDLPENSNINAGRSDNSNNWEVIVRYNGRLDKIAEELDVVVEILSNSYAIITLSADKIRSLAGYSEIEYIERPRRLGLMLNNSLRNSCITNVQNGLYGQLNGKGVAIGIIDSGIDYTHRDFRNEDGSSRILYIWDQTIEGNPPDGFNEGSEYNKEMIDLALNQTNISQTYNIVPHRDDIGHGTHDAFFLCKYSNILKIKI